MPRNPFRSKRARQEAQEAMLGLALLVHLLECKDCRDRFIAAVNQATVILTKQAETKGTSNADNPSGD